MNKLKFHFRLDLLYPELPQTSSNNHQQSLWKPQVPKIDLKRCYLDQNLYCSYLAKSASHNISEGTRPQGVNIIFSNQFGTLGLPKTWIKPSTFLILKKV